jgi:hypothetical protein
LQLICEDLSEEKLMAIIDKCPVLESLEISSRISGERVEELEARYARLKILSVLLLLAQMKSLAVICENIMALRQ